MSDDQKLESLRRIANGEPIANVRKAVGLDAWEWSEYVRLNPSFAKDVKRALDQASREIADDLLHSDMSDPVSIRTRLEVTKWWTSKMSPEVFGDALQVKVEHTINLVEALRGREAGLLPERNVDVIEGYFEVKGPNDDDDNDEVEI